MNVKEFGEIFDQTFEESTKACLDLISDNPITMIQQMIVSAKLAREINERLTERLVSEGVIGKSEPNVTGLEDLLFRR